jgi:HSP20 family molecular chaperone IbpA
MAESKFGHGQGMDEWSRSIGDILDEMRNRSFFDFRDSGAWQPATNVYETAGHYYICVELAGVLVEGISVECLGQNRVAVLGRRRQPRPAGQEGPLSVHVMEIDEGPFAREFDLPEPFDDEASHVSYSEGYLWIILPKITKR